MGFISVENINKITTNISTYVFSVKKLIYQHCRITLFNYFNFTIKKIFKIKYKNIYLQINVMCL